MNSLFHKPIENFSRLNVVPASIFIEEWSTALVNICHKYSKVTLIYDQINALLTIFLNSQKKKFSFLWDASKSWHVKRHFILYIFKDILDPFLINYILLIIQENRAHLLKIIFQKVLTLINLSPSESHGIIYSVITLSKIQIEQISLKIKQKYQLLGAVFVNEIDKKLIGGIKIKINDLVIDDSILNKLKRYKNLS